MLSKIPKTFKIGLINKVVDSSTYTKYSNNGKRLFRINPIPKKEATPTKLRSITEYHYHDYKDTIKYIDVLNTGFTIKLNTSNYDWRYYNSLPIIELYHDKFKDLPYQPYISISYHHLLQLLSTVEGKLLEGAEFPGTFKIKVVSTGHYPIYFLVNENCPKDLDKLSIRYGNLLETVNRTSKWIPGHMYVLSDRSVLLYVGKIKDIVVERSSYYNYSTTLYNLFDATCSNLFSDSSKKSISENNALVIRLYKYNSEDYSHVLNPDLSKLVDMKSFIDNFFNKKVIGDEVNLMYLKLKDNHFPLATDFGKLVNFSSEFFEDDLLPMFIERVENKVKSGKIQYEENTKDLYFSPWIRQYIQVLPSVSSSILKEILASNKYLIDEHVSGFPLGIKGAETELLNSIINYKKGDSRSWKDSALFKFSEDIKKLLNGDNPVFGKIERDILINMLSELYA